MKTLAELVIGSGAVEFRNVELSSGRESNYYINMKEAFARPHILQAIAKEVSGKITSDKIAGMELGAVPILVAVSLHKHIPFAIIRKEGRTHGTGDPFIGRFVRGESVDLIEDVTTTGRTLIESACRLRAAGAIIKTAICVVDREEGAQEALRNIGIELMPLLRKSELIKQKVRT